MKIDQYCVEKSNVPSELARELEAKTLEQHPLGHMVTGSLVASFLGFLIRSKEVKSILEIGTFTGFSALAMAENLPSDGIIHTIDKNKKINKVASEYWQQSDHGKKITAFFGDAMTVTRTFIEEQRKYDLIFIDADKRNYKNYLLNSLELLNPNGVIIIDNVIWGGRVVEIVDEKDPTYDKSTQYIQELNDYIAQRDDLYATLIPIRDGLFLVQRI